MIRPEPPKRRAPRRCPQHALVGLHACLLRDRERIAAEGLHATDYAAAASQELGCEISVRTVRTVAGLAGIEFAKQLARARKAASGPPSREEFNAVCRAVEALAKGRGRNGMPAEFVELLAGLNGAPPLPLFGEEGRTDG